MCSSNNPEEHVNLVDNIVVVRYACHTIDNFQIKNFTLTNGAIR